MTHVQFLKPGLDMVRARDPCDAALSAGIAQRLAVCVHFSVEPVKIDGCCFTMNGAELSTMGLSFSNVALHGAWEPRLSCLPTQRPRPLPGLAGGSVPKLARPLLLRLCLHSDYLHRWAAERGRDRHGLRGVLPGLWYAWCLPWRL